MDPLTTPHHDQTPRPPAWLDGAVRRLEEAPSLDRLVTSLRSFAGPVGHGEIGDALRGRWLGHALHPLLTDLPIGCWTSAALLDIVGGVRGREASQRLVGLGLAFVPLTAAAGLADWSAVRDAPTRRVGAAHAAGNVAASACYVQSWRNRRRGRHWRGVGWGMAGGALASVAGYLGGHLAFGRSSSDQDEATVDASIDLRQGETAAVADHVSGGIQVDPSTVPIAP
jgi:uncharacterized membrane protein